MVDLEQFRDNLLHNPNDAFLLATEALEKKSFDLDAKMKLAYREELFNCRGIYSLSAPCSKEVGNFLEYRIRHYDEFKQMQIDYLQKKFSSDFLTNYGLPEQYPAKALNGFLQNKTEQSYNFPYSDAFRNDLIYRTKKYQLTSPIMQTSGWNQNISTFYMGTYNGQNVLFVERTFFNTKTRNSGGYEMGVIINGKANGYMRLYADHFNAEENHISKMVNGHPNVAENCYANDQSGLYSAYSAQLYKSVNKSHRHISTELFGVVYPHSYAYDSVACPDYKNLTDMFYKNRVQNEMVKGDSLLTNLNSDIDVNAYYEIIKKQADKKCMEKEASKMVPPAGRLELAV